MTCVKISLRLLFIFACFQIIANCRIIDAHEVLCRRCGATITKLQNALKEEDTPPTNGESHEIQLDEDLGDVKKLVRLSNGVGQTFDLALFRTAQVKTIPATRSIKDSFFPGYAWRVAECPVCGAFLGWSFDRPAHCHHQETSVTTTTTTADQSKVSAKTNEESHVDIDAILNKAFAFTCLTKSLGYWNVEWCHKKHVTQFHIPGPTLQRNPEYSLGQFDSVVDTGADGKLQPGTRRQIEQKFKNGQKCDETSTGRSSIVTLMCCAQYHNSANLHQSAFIASFREPFICMYELVVCVPELCAIPDFVPKAQSTSASVSTHAQTATSDDAVCASGAPPAKSPRWFYGFDWSALVCEKSSDMSWTRTLRPMLGTGSLM